MLNKKDEAVRYWEKALKKKPEAEKLRKKIEEKKLETKPAD
jgi:hypothetical protein